MVGRGATYGHLAHDAEDQDRLLLDPYDAAPQNGRGHVVGTNSEDRAKQNGPENEKTPRNAGSTVERAREDSNL